MKDTPSLARSYSPFQTPIYLKAILIPNPRQPPTKYHTYQTIILPNQQYKSAPCESSPTHINNIVSIRKHYPAKAVTRSKPTRPNNYNPYLFEITVRLFSLYSISNRTITLRKLLAEYIVQTCFKNKHSRQSYRTNRPKPAESSTGLNRQEPRTSDNRQHDQTLQPP